MPNPAKFISYISMGLLFFFGALGPVAYFSQHPIVWQFARGFGSSPMPVAFSHFKSYEYWAQKVEVSLSFKSEPSVTFVFDQPFLDSVDINHQLQTAYMIPVSLAPVRSSPWWADSLEFSYCKLNGPFRRTLKLKETPQTVLITYRSRMNPSLKQEVTYKCANTI